VNRAANDTAALIEPAAAEPEGVEAAPPRKTAKAKKDDGQASLF
jgi:hypothetical protein